MCKTAVSVQPVDEVASITPLLAMVRAYNLEERENKKEEWVDTPFANNEQNIVHKRCFCIQYAAWK